MYVDRPVMIGKEECPRTADGQLEPRAFAVLCSEPLLRYSHLQKHREPHGMYSGISWKTSYSSAKESSSPLLVDFHFELVLGWMRTPTKLKKPSIPIPVANGVRSSSSSTTAVARNKRAKLKNIHCPRRMDFPSSRIDSAIALFTAAFDFVASFAASAEFSAIVTIRFAKPC